MPRFYLHLRKGENFFRDPEGGEFVDLEAARHEAAQVAQELVAENIKFGQEIEGQFEIADERGENLLVVVLKDAVKIKSPASTKR